MRFRILEVAEIEAMEAAWWYDEQRRGLGDEFFSELGNSYAEIRNTPEGGSLLEGFDGPERIYRRQLKRFPYLVIYRIQQTEILVLAVSHARRRPLYWVERLEG